MAIEINPAHARRKRLTQGIAFGTFRILSYGIALLLFYILGFIIVKGIGVINWDFLTLPPQRAAFGRQ